MKIRHRLSVRLSLLLSIVVVPSLAMVAVMVIRHEGGVVEGLVLKEAKTAALQGAAVYGSALDTAVDTYAATCTSDQTPISKDLGCLGLSLSEILEPAYAEIRFKVVDGVVLAEDDPAYPIKGGTVLSLDDKRYSNKLSKYVAVHGIQTFEDATKTAGGFLFSTGMDRRGFVPITHKNQDKKPRGNATPENAAYDKIYSRGNRKYDGAEQIAAAGFTGNPKAQTLVQDYPRDTGEMAWDVAAPIYVKGQHFGGFRVGVARDRVEQQYHDLTVGLSILFGLIALAFVGITMWLSYHYIKPLSVLSDRATELSMSGDPAVLDVRIKSTEPTEIGEMARSLERLRSSLSAAMRRLNAHQGVPHLSPQGRGAGDSP
jgi:HAMP domain-containing protein